MAHPIADPLPTDDRDRAPLMISVVVPSLNSGAFIAEALRSALTQDSPPHEVIVQDGGSTDDTLEILQDFGDAITWQSEPDGGQSEALNRAIERATGDIVIWLNADDVFVPGAFTAAGLAFQQDPAAEFAYGDFDLIRADGSILRQFKSSPYDPMRVFSHGSYIFSGSIFYRRELMSRVGPFDDQLQACMDFDYLLRLGMARSIHIESTIARFRMSGAGKSSLIRSKFLQETHAVRWRVAGRSRRLRALTILLDVHDALVLWTQPLRHTHVWTAVRGRRRL